MIARAVCVSAGRHSRAQTSWCKAFAVDGADGTVSKLPGTLMAPSMPGRPCCLCFCYYLQAMRSVNSFSHDLLWSRQRPACVAPHGINECLTTWPRLPLGDAAHEFSRSTRWLRRTPPDPSAGRKLVTMRYGSIFLCGVSPPMRPPIHKGQRQREMRGPPAFWRGPMAL